MGARARSRCNEGLLDAGHALAPPPGTVLAYRLLTAMVPLIAVS